MYDIRVIIHTKDGDFIENRNANKANKRTKEYEFR